MNRFMRISAVTVSLCLAAKAPALACATCYGASDSPLAQGMNWGIITLLGVVGFVMFGIVAFFVHVGRKAARLNADGQISNSN